MLGYIEMKNGPPLMRQQEEDKENTKGGGGNGEEINGDEVSHMIV